jgi:hypothetical protein
MQSFSQGEFMNDTPQVSPSVALQGNVLGTRKGVWVIDVQGTEKTDGAALTIKLLLKNRQLHRRTLTLQVEPSALEWPSFRELLACATRAWIESTEGHGYLDLTSLASHAE